MLALDARFMSIDLWQHEPFPALVMDRYWNVLMTNECTLRFFNYFIEWLLAVAN
jgi:hypothetical protein